MARATSLASYTNHSVIIHSLAKLCLAVVECGRRSLGLLQTRGSYGSYDWSCSTPTLSVNGNSIRFVVYNYVFKKMKIKFYRHIKFCKQNTAMLIVLREN